MAVSVSPTGGLSTRKWLAEQASGGVVPLDLFPNGFKSAENARLNRRRGKYMVIAHIGVACGVAKGYRFRWFALTESNEAIKAGLDFGKVFHRLMDMIRYYCPDVQYLAVEHRQGDKARRNWHILTYGSDKLPMKTIEAWWVKHYLSHTGKFAEVKDVAKAIKYMAAYQSDEDKFVRYFRSQGWIYSGWSKTSYEAKKINGRYPDRADVAKLSRMGLRERQIELDYLINTGGLSVSCSAESTPVVRAPVGEALLQALIAKEF